MYPSDSDLHLVALSPELQHQQSNTTMKLNIQHHLQQAAKTPARCDYAETQQTSHNQGRRPHQFYTLPPLGGGYHATQRTPPTSTPHVKGTQTTGSPNPLYRPYVDTAYKYASI